MAKSSGGVILGLAALAGLAVLAMGGTATAAPKPTPKPLPPTPVPTPKPGGSGGVVVPPPGGGVRPPIVVNPTPIGPPAPTTRTVGPCAVEQGFPYDQDLVNLLSSAPLDGSVDPSAAPAVAGTLSQMATVYEGLGYPLAGTCLRTRASALTTLAATQGSTGSGA